MAGNTLIVDSKTPNSKRFMNHPLEKNAVPIMARTTQPSETSERGNAVRR
jgi:hypothetical protein